MHGLNLTRVQTVKLYRLGILGVALWGMAGAAWAAPPGGLQWKVVVNNDYYIPTNSCNPASTPPAATCRKFNSYNPPSVNTSGLVVFRARSRGGHEGGGGEPVHGVYTRDMASPGPVVKIFDRGTQVPQPNNRGTQFVEPPSFPRIDMWSNTVASRANHPPVWQVTSGGEVTEQVGTTGIYTDPFGSLTTGASRLGTVPDFSFFQVPEAPGVPFDVFPGAPAVTDGATIVFKGNYTQNLIGKTGVYYRDLKAAPIPVSGGSMLAPAAGTHPVVLIADNTSSVIPGTDTVFGSVSPPSAAGRFAVFSGFNNEDSPTLGGIYRAPLDGTTLPPLTTLVSIGEQVPGEAANATFNRLGEGLSYDGRFVGFWGAWGTETRTLILQCPTTGNADRIAFCNQNYPTGFTVQVPVHQGIFVYDTKTGQLRALAKTPQNFTDFLYWSFTGHVPGSSEGNETDEPARWRSATFLAVSGLVNGSLADVTFHAAFKARTGSVSNGAWVNPVDGIYLAAGPGSQPFTPLVRTGMDGTVFDPLAVDAATGAPLLVSEMGIERDGFRGDTVVVNVSMGAEETGWAGIYLTRLRPHP